VSWTPPPEPLEWPLVKPVDFGGMKYVSALLRAPTGEDVMKATAIPGVTGVDQQHHLIAAVSGVPYDVLKMQPYWLIRKMSDYFDEFMGAPAPDPLESWRKARREAAMAEAQAAAKVTTPAS
jgi:hypothetical protein